MSKEFITTPIYYVNDIPHIGHAYTTIIADTLARYFRLTGEEVFFLTGTDEHGQKIELSAKAKGKTPKQYADEISGKFKQLWDEFGISYDHFIRTTDEEHMSCVKKAFSTMMKKGDIYKGFYEGNYCVSCESFFTKSQLVNDTCCPDCGKETKIVSEESYFFKLSKYQDKLLNYHENNEKSVIPKAKQNEVISFIKQGLDDLSITRTSFDWGIKLPEEIKDERHVIYVWLDALLNYLSALNYAASAEKMDFWPASYHIVGKDILRFHAIFWPAFLMSLELPMPKHIAAHGWWTRDGEKISKSKGNAIDPRLVSELYGLDNFRFYLLKEATFGQDGDFREKSLIERINSDLANDLGNLLNRIVGMSEKYSAFKIDSKNVEKFYSKQLDQAKQIILNLPELMQSLQSSRYIEELWKMLSIANQSIAFYEPWKLIKEDKSDEALALVALCANLLAKVAIMLSPIMPSTCEKITKSLGFSLDQTSYKKYILNDELLPVLTCEKIPPLFPRIEKALMPEVKPLQNEPENTKKATKKPNEELINIDDFFKSSIKIGTIIKANEVPKSDKLLIFEVDLGEQKPRQILSGIKKYYTPIELIGTQVCVVANLKPAKLMGYESCGMILTASKDGKLLLIRPEDIIANGAVVS